MAKKRYRVQCVGRQNGAIGILHAIDAIVEAEDKDGALLAMYARYEHLSPVHQYFHLGQNQDMTALWDRCITELPQEQES